MRCLTCKGPLDSGVDGGGDCVRCFDLNAAFNSLARDNPDAAYNWAMQKALDLAGDITGIEPGSAYVTVEDGEPQLHTVDRVKTTVARYVPPELRKNDGRKEED